jgi:hypothetical protein
VKQVWEQDARSRKQLANRAHDLKAALLDTTTVLRRAKQGERCWPSCFAPALPGQCANKIDSRGTDHTTCLGWLDRPGRHATRELCDSERCTSCRLATPAAMHV